MEKNYEKMYDILVDYENEMHLKNQKKIKIGLGCIWIIPLIFLCLLFWTDSSKVVFLILWIASLFGIAIYLILVEYSDYKLQKKLAEIRGQEDEEIDALIAPDLSVMEGRFRMVMERIDANLNAPEELVEEKKKELLVEKVSEEEKETEVKEFEEHI